MDSMTFMNDSQHRSQAVSPVICGYTEECPFARFVYISVAGFISIFGVVSNALLFYVFLSKRHANSPSNFYPAVLAVLDILLCIAYLLLFVVDVNMVYLENKELFHAYHSYIITVLTFSKMNQLAIPYLLILATCERMAWVTERYRSLVAFRRQGRQFTVFTTIFLSILIRFPAFFMLYVQEFWACRDPMRTLAVAPTKRGEEFFWFAYDTYFIVIIQTVIPFIVLISLNVVIVRRLIDSNADLSKETIVEKRLERMNSASLLATLKINKMSAAVQSAVYTMMAIVCTYLFSNGLHIFLLLLEKTNASILHVNGDPYTASTFYTALSDSVSILYMVSSAIRILIYGACNPTIRHDLKAMFRGASKNPNSLIIGRSENGLKKTAPNAQL